MQRFAIKISLACAIQALLPASAQTNLVFNPGFEQHSKCPEQHNQIHLATGWTDHMGSPDLYSSCYGASCINVPWDCNGFQHAAEGTSYAGILAYGTNPCFIEMLGTTLLDTLRPRTKYYMSMKVSLAEMYWSGSDPLFLPANNIGMRFSTVPFSNATLWPPINNFAHLTYTSVISDTTNWTTVSGSFVADSAYLYLTIGNFFDSASTTVMPRPNGHYTYFFVDDVVVSTDSAVLLLQVNRQPARPLLSIFPNPASDKVKILMSTTDFFKATLSDLNGNAIFREVFEGQGFFRITDMPAGVYLITVETSNNVWKEKILIVPDN